MKVNVRFHSRFKHVFGDGEQQIELDSGSTIRDLLTCLCVTDVHSKTLYAEKDQRLRHDVLVTKNGRFVFHMKRLDTELEEGDRVAILYPACMG